VDVALNTLVNKFVYGMHVSAGRHLPGADFGLYAKAVYVILIIQDRESCRCDKAIVLSGRGIAVLV